MRPRWGFIFVLVLFLIIGVSILQMSVRVIHFASWLALLFLAYLLYNLKIPYYSTVKGLFLISAVIPFVYFAIKGVDNFLVKHQLIYIIYLFIYCLLILKNFWIIPSWYR